LLGWKWEPVVRALLSLRGVQVLPAMPLVAEAGDMRRFEEPRSLINFYGLTSSEHSAAASVCRAGSPNAGTRIVAGCSPKRRGITG
jgi:transposase